MRPGAGARGRYGKLHLVDLAGSERLKDSKSANDAAAETAHIALRRPASPRSEPPGHGDCLKACPRKPAIQDGGSFSQ